MFGTTLTETAEIEGVPFDVSRLYADYKLATLTGWTLEYIERLGYLTVQAFLQMWEAEQSLKAPKRKGKVGI